jgi:S-adenosylmethionine synthetase
MSGSGRYAAQFDFRSGAIIEQLDLLRPLYGTTVNYGHFGKPDLPWESPDLIQVLNPRLR